MKNLIGFKVNYLTIIREVDRKTKSGKKMLRRFLCFCSRCNSHAELDMLVLTRKEPQKTCGCIRREKMFETKNIKHYTRLYRIWYKMLDRCENPKAKDFHRYGGRGIKICKRWHNFSHFYDDTIDGYKPGLTTERIDVDSDYKPSNCKWITRSEQAKNRRSGLEYRKRTGYKWKFGRNQELGKK